ncbi:MAG: tetratricopeptide repeat protein, partial [Candidatus Omnitrophota bacterium]
LKSCYLRWRAYEYNESEDDARNAFEMFQSALMEYVKASKDMEKIKEYASILKKSGKSRLSVRLHNLYIEQSLANQDYTPIFEIAAEYARENDFEQTRIVLRDALKHDPPDETACAMLKFIAESYLPDRQPDNYYAVMKEIVENYSFNKYTEEAFNKAKSGFREYDYGLKAEVTKEGKENGYISYLKSVADKFKGTELAADSLCFLGDYYASKGKKQEAAALFEEIIEEYPECRWAESLLEKLRDGENI